jgi:hypothetical protein
MAARKKPAAKKKPAKARSTTVQRRGGTTNRRPRLNSAQRAQRDSLMVARRVQGWTWEAIAQEAGVTVTTAQKAVDARSNTPIHFNADPVRVIEDVFTAYQLSIGDFEAIAMEALAANNYAAAVGAKKGANDARDKVLTLLQLTGRLPHELGSLRHLIDLRAIAVRMLDTMDAFEERIAAMAFTPEDRLQIREATREVRTTFNELLGIEPEQQALPEAA